MIILKGIGKIEESISLYSPDIRGLRKTKNIGQRRISRIQKLLKSLTNL
jgi:hypothetical protein